MVNGITLAVDKAIKFVDHVILYLQKETKIAIFRYLRKLTEAVKDKDYELSLVLKIPFNMLIPFTLFVGFRTVH